MQKFKTKGISPKLIGPLVAVLASASSFVTTAIESGHISRIAASALAASLFTAASVAIAGPGNVVPVDEFGEELPILTPDTGVKP